MTTKEQQSLSDKIADGLRNALTEMEEFRVQLALGKAEARDLYEESKKKLNRFISEAKVKAADLEKTAGAEFVKLKTAFESLQVQLALGKADTKDAFEEQRKKIVASIAELETAIRSQKVLNEYYTRLLLEMDKFKIKLDILKLRFELKKLDAREEFEARKKDLQQYISDMQNRLLRQEKGKLEHFQDEISKAYHHFKNAFAH